ncbi:hypothetical protein SESBI_22059 [Sesbania bispinosa]|nr:hypothetical protein SESBI_22059 [Sesbania bispinosa]
MVFPGQTLLPNPNGANLKSDPIMFTSSFMNLSGLNSSGSAHTFSSCVMAHIFTMAVVPAGTSLSPTQIRRGRPCPLSRPLHRRLAGGDRLHRTLSSISRELLQKTVAVSNREKMEVGF